MNFRTKINAFLSENIIDGENLLIDEPASKYQKCIYINKGNCSKFKAKEKDITN